MNPLAVGSLAWRELVRFFRQPSRVMGAAGTPLLFWALLGTGLSSSFRMPGGPSGMNYKEYFFPGTIFLVVLFASIFSTISVIEDRNQGFLQGVLAAPIGRVSIVAGKILGGAAIAWLQGILFLLLAPLVGIRMSLAGALGAAGVLALVAMALAGIGFAFAWRVDSVQGFHAVMNLLLFPMWLLSGSFFPISGAPRWLAFLMRLNPLTYGLAAMRALLYGPRVNLGTGVPGLGPSVAVIAGVGVLALAADVMVMRRGRID
jgi:ABC-2 type transport system permease protein